MTAKVGVEFFAYTNRNCVFDSLEQFKCVFQVPGEIQAMKEDLQVVVIATVDEDGFITAIQDSTQTAFTAFKVYPITPKGQYEL